VKETALRCSRMASLAAVAGDDKLSSSQSHRAVSSQWTRVALIPRLLCLVLLTAATVWGQATTSLRGTVTDSSGSVVVGATVALESTESGSQRTTTTGTQGEYEFSLLPPGVYALTVTATGFERYEQTGLQLLVSTPATANAQLKVGAANEKITVTGETLAFNVVDASIGNTFEETQITQLPLEGRNVPDLLSVQAGVAYTGDRPDINTVTDTRSGAVNGARSDQSNISLDGVDVNDQGNGFAFTSVLPVTLDSVREFRVVTSNYNADQGTGSGAQVALVTKNGTNTFHGSVYEYLRNTVTSANDYFVKQSELATGEPNKPPALNRNIFGESLGGPIKKDRLFFFENYEGTRQSEQQSEVSVVPTATLRAGIVEYPNVNGTVTSLSPAQITALDPLHLGPNPAMLAYFNTYPLPNDNTVGDGGLNFAGYRFRAPTRLDNNAIIARADYQIDASGKQTIFWRGALQNLSNPQAPFLPGAPPLLDITDHSRGFVVGYTAILSNTMVNTFHWGLTRQSTDDAGSSDLPWNTFATISQGISYGQSFQMPVNNLLDDFSWTKGAHTLQFGASIGIVRDPRQSTLSSFSSANLALGNMSPTGFANQPSSPLDPIYGGFPAVNGSDDRVYDDAMGDLLGMTETISAVYNYTKAGAVLPQGTPIKRDYGLDWYEFYGQDTWRMKPNLTLTFGVRWSIFPPPWEVNGLQVGPNVNIGNLFLMNERNMEQGLGYELDPTISYILAGKANNGPPLYKTAKDNFGPRVALAYSLRPQSGWRQKALGYEKTVIRGGFSEVYDRAGMQLMNSFQSLGSFGLTTTLQNAPVQDGAATVARITSLNVIPTTTEAGKTVFLPAPPGGFPATPPSGNQDGESLAWGINNNLQTPHAYALDLSVARELPKRFTLQLAYVGRLGRNLLQEEDLMPQLDMRDTTTGIDYFTAADRLSHLVRTNVPTSSITDALVGPTAAFWQDEVQPLLPGGAYSLICSGGSTQNVVQAVYDVYKCAPLVEVVALGDINYFGALTDANHPGVSYYFKQGPFSWQNPQFGSYYAWSSIGKSDYNALQVNLKKQLGNGVQLDLNYTYSRSIDISSSATRVATEGGTSGNQGLVGDSTVNSFDPNQLRGPSDFDLTHQFNANWIVELPFGKGKTYLSQAGGLLDGLVGGWQWSGLARWTSGFPVSVSNGESWPTSWDRDGPALQIGHPQTGVYQVNGAVNMFANPTAALGDFTEYFPGQSGTRNGLRGDGFAGLDMSLSKRWRMPFEGQSLQFRWEVFNVPNLVRFNVQTASLVVDQTSNFGEYSSLLTNPRVMEFALRYEF
jgi:hypothetical protein